MKKEIKKRTAIDYLKAIVALVGMGLGLGIFFGMIYLVFKWFVGLWG